MTNLEAQLERLDRILDAQEFIPQRIRCAECNQYFVPDDDEDTCQTCKEGEE